MGIFSKVLGGLFGGGSKTSQTTKTTTKTNVDVNIDNIINLDGIKAVFELFVNNEAQEAKTDQLQVLQLLKVQKNRNTQLKEANKSFRILVLGGLSIGAVLIFRKKKRKRKSKK